MRVAFVLGHSSPFPGAAWSRVRAHAEALASGGDRVDIVGVVTPTAMGRAGVRRQNGIRLLNLVPGISSNRAGFVAGNVAASLAAALLVSQLRPDVVILSVPPASFAVGGFLGARIAHAGLVIDHRDEWERYTLEANPGRAGHRVVARLAAWMARVYLASDLVVTATMPLAANLRARGVREATVIPNGAPLEAFRSADRGRARRALGFHDADMVLVFAGPLNAYYRLDVAAEALAEVITRHRDRVSLLLVGDGSERDAAKVVAKAGPASKRVVFVGSRTEGPELAEVVSAGDAGIVPLDDNPYWDTTLPAKVYQYCAASLPVIATVRAKSLLAKTIADFDFGRAISPLHPEALADVVHEFATDPGLRRRLGDNARRFAAGFDRQEIAKGFAARVRAIAEERSSRMPRVPPP